ncbi:hypothetical protein GCM10018962_52130 [Dactylosporangium matsuzakiense]|uniref:NAD(P)-binding domain-containing protein n=1 Tax=Dactylosporangium matsuzakiense TaxID=53360 RepID=A0A9W6KTN9_9ACTN|nr:hypothetical protein GCM10017581_087630 [Dactylosporangium matsuzakiense]
MQARGVRVRTFVRDPDTAAARLGRDVELARGDLADEESLVRALDGVDRLYLSAGAGLPDWLVTHLAGVFGIIRAGGFEHTTPHVMSITGHAGRSVAAFARDHAAAFTPAGQPV